MEKQLIYLADDHIVLRDALAQLINGFDHCEVIGKGANGQDLLDDLEKGLRPNFLLLDLNMPVMDGYETAKWLRANRPDIKILVLSMFDSHVAVIRLLKAGVRGMLKKDSSPETLQEAIYALAEKGYYYGRTSSENVMAFFAPDGDDPSNAEKGLLTEDEIAYLKLTATEITYKEMSAALKLSPNNLETMRSNLFQKLDVKSRVGLVLYAVKHGIISF